MADDARYRIDGGVEHAIATTLTVTASRITVGVGVAAGFVAAVGGDPCGRERCLKNWRVL